MRAVIQRVAEANVAIDATIKGAIGKGLVVLLAVQEADKPEDIDWLSGKIARLRIFDDAEGVMNFQRCLHLNVPNNVAILKLPDVPSFREFDTQGPSGRHLADINGKAAAIECYLDLDRDASIRWNNYNPKLGVYQGELIGKTE